MRGFAQKNSFDYNEIYSPVAKMTTIRTLLSIGNQYSFNFVQLDVKTAFLNGDLKDEIYINPPEGIKCKQGNVLRLQKSLYGLKQSSKCWNERINEFLLKSNFVRSHNDYCLYVRKFNNGEVYLLLYVDDIILAGVCMENINICKFELMKEFDIKDKGVLKYFLGLEIDYNKREGILRISQRRYVMKILNRFNFENCKSCKIPIDPKLVLKEDECRNDNKKPIRELIGCLMFLMLGSRPDISFSVNYFSRYQDICSE